MGRISASAFALALAFCGRAYAQTDAQVAERLTPTVHACEKSPENSGTFEQALCYKDEVARQNDKLNETWTHVIERLSPNRRKALRISERRWIKERDNDCRAEATDYINSTASYMFNVCAANATIRRTIWLETFR